MNPGNLTKNFTLPEFLKSKIADKNGFKEQYQPPDMVVKNLQILCENVLQPLRDLIGEVSISSGYRCERVNKAAGGKSLSQHTTGNAADIQFFEYGKMNNRIIIDAILENNIEFDQMIWENGGQWVHISYKQGKNRKQYFTL